MILVALGLTFAGYSVFYYGLTQVQGKNYGYLTLVVPGRYKPENPSPTSGKTTSKPASSIPGSDVTASTGKTAKGADTYGGGGTPGPVY